MRRILSVLIFLITLSTYGQKEANYWYFGQKAGLDFSSGSPVVLNDGQLETLEGCSTISDKTGKLLFYSDGTTVYDSTHQIMKYSNGSLANDLNGNPSSTQSALVVPHPTDATIYYLFTVGTNANSGLNLYTVDVSRNGGLGEIINGPTDLSDGKAGNWSEKVTAVQGDDCNTIWILSTVNNQFYAYKIDGTGVDTANPIISTTTYSLRDRRGYLKVSPDGKKIALADFRNNGALVLYDFDSSNGSVSNLGTILASSSGDGAHYGIEFSQSSSKLYTSTYDGTNNKLFQFDLTQNNIANSKNLIHSQIGYRGALQLAVDGKIYAITPVSYQIGTQFLDVIENPEEDATNVTYTEDKIDLGVGIATQGLPPFIQSFFSPVKILDSDTKSIDLTLGTQQVCIGNTFSFEPELTGIAGSTFKWTKAGDPSVNITTRAISIDYTNYGSGTYNLEMTINDTCGRTLKYNGSVEILFVPKPTIIAIPVYEQCDIDANTVDGITTFNLQSKEAALTNNTAGFSVTFFETTDLNFSSPILNEVAYINTDSTNTGNHKLVTRITNDTTGCYEDGIIELKANATSLTTYPDLYLSELDLNTNIPDSRNSLGSGNTNYDFNLKTAEIIGNSSGAFSNTTHNFEYYRTANDASLQTNQIIAPFEDDLFTDNSDVFVRISTKGSNACSGIGQFKIFVNTRPVPQGNTTSMYLCVNNPIDSPQQITIDLNGFTGVLTDTYQWFLNGNLITGATNAIHKANVQGTYKVEAYRAYPNDVNDVTDDSSCTGYNTFTVLESNKALIVSTELTDDQDNPEANILTIVTSGIGDYEYALNSTRLADFTKGTDNFSFTFNQVKPGINTVYIRNVNGCGIASSQKLSFLFFQRHFSPNNDGVRDTWRILGTNNTFYKSARVEIFDRFGKVVALITDKDGNGWDGTYNGSKLPSNDYWFNAVLEDINGNIRKETGNFSLLRK
ncbi:MAG: T9SS type B sorting domain-containing protein [Polaribacter sp.]|nr:T9SS type B sorting domain-containing protein [Polaribacter sp.]